VRIPTSLDGFTKHSWAASFHSSGTGTALDKPLVMGGADLPERIVRFSGYYQIVTTGAPLLALEWRLCCS